MYNGTWEGQKQLCWNWADRLKLELESRDLWTELARYQESFTLSPREEIEDTPISAEEADEIRNSIEELEAKLFESYSLGEEQQKFISGRLDYLAETARRQGKFTWVHTAIGVLVTIAWSISPDDLGYYWRLVQSAFRPFMRLVGAP